MSQAPPRPVTAGVALRLLLALACVAVPAWIAATRWSVLVSGHPAYPVALLAVAVLGFVLAVLALRGRPRGGALRTTGRVVGALGVLAVLGALVWLRPFAAEPVAVAATVSSSAVEVVDATTTWELRPRGGATGAGLVFYPGARVDPRAYLALLRPLAERGHLVVVVKPPLDFALLSTGAAAAVLDAHPEVAGWAVGGHSLGGVAAASYAEGDPRVRGLLLWASYPAGNLSRAPLAAASVSGELDGLTTPTDIAESRALLPPATTFTEVPGAVHAYFGDYGPQPGDGEPSVGREQAQRRIVEASTAFLAGIG